MSVPLKADGVNGFAQSFLLKKNSIIFNRKFYLIKPIYELKAQLVDQAGLYLHFVAPKSLVSYSVIRIQSQRAWIAISN